jgi:transcription elongation factor GreB
MGRWKPPPPKSSPYITEQGFDTLQTELRALWERRKGVTKALAVAAAEGDRSENAEYIYRKKELREIDYRIRYLQKRLPSLKVISEKPGDQDRIFFGVWITLKELTLNEVSLEKQQDEQVRYRIVGPDEISGEGYISIDSPLARAALKKTFDDEIVVKTEYGSRRYVIMDIEYN